MRKKATKESETLSIIVKEIYNVGLRKCGCAKIKLGKGGVWNDGRNDYRYFGSPHDRRTFRVLCH